MSIGKAWIERELEILSECLQQSRDCKRYSKTRQWWLNQIGNTTKKSEIKISIVSLNSNKTKNSGQFFFCL